MRAHPQKQLPVVLVWAVLMVASLIGFALADGFAPPRVAASLAIVIAAFKVRLVITQYMEVRREHQPLCLLLTLWLAAVTVILLAGYWSV